LYLEGLFSQIAIVSFQFAFSTTRTLLVKKFDRIRHNSSDFFNSFLFIPISVTLFMWYAF